MHHRHAAGGMGQIPCDLGLQREESPRLHLHNVAVPKDIRHHTAGFGRGFLFRSEQVGHGALVAGLVGAEVELNGGVKPLFPQGADMGGVGGGCMLAHAVAGREQDLVGDGLEAQCLGGGHGALGGDRSTSHNGLLSWDVNLGLQG